MELEECRDRSLDLVSTPIRFGRHNRHSRHKRRPLLEPVAMGRRGSAGGAEREPARTGATKGLLSGLAAVVEAEGPRARAGRLDDQVEADAGTICIFCPDELAGAVALRLGRLDEASRENRHGVSSVTG